MPGPQFPFQSTATSAFRWLFLPIVVSSFSGRRETAPESSPSLSAGLGRAVGVLLGVRLRDADGRRWVGERGRKGRGGRERGGEGREGRGGEGRRGGGGRSWDPPPGPSLVTSCWYCVKLGRHKHWFLFCPPKNGFYVVPINHPQN